MIISSQRYIDDAIVAKKIAAGDFVVTLSPSFDFDGKTYQVVLDGHHSLEAARVTGVIPEYVIASRENDHVILLDDGKITDFLESTWIDSDWYDVTDGVPIW